VEPSPPATEPPAVTQSAALTASSAAEVSIPFGPEAVPPSTPTPGWVRLSRFGLGIGVGGMIGFGMVVPAIALFGGGLLALSAGWSYWVRARARRYDAATHEVLRALGRGDRTRVRSILTPWLHRGPAFVRVHARHNLAWSELTGGDAATAIRLLAASEGEAKALRTVGMHATCAVNLALAHALLGELAAAHAWLAETDRRMAAATSRSSTDQAMKTYVRAILDCREGRPADAARALADAWAELEALLTGGTARPLRILRAFATAVADPRDAGKADRLLTPPSYPGEYDFLAAAWPEMGAFLAAHQLGADAS
jgi:hypothetical protein